MVDRFRCLARQGGSKKLKGFSTDMEMPEVCCVDLVEFVDLQREETHHFASANR